MIFGLSKLASRAQAISTTAQPCAKIRFRGIIYIKKDFAYTMIQFWGTLLVCRIGTFLAEIFLDYHILHRTWNCNFEHPCSTYQSTCTILSSSTVSQVMFRIIKIGSNKNCNANLKLLTIHFLIIFKVVVPGSTKKKVI